MNIKKFQAQAETEAIMLAREELGKDAIVMNIKTVQPRGIYRFFRKPTVEITAAVDDVSSGDGEKMLSRLKELHKKIPNNLDIIQEEEVRREEIQNSTKKETSAIEERLNNLQDMLEKQMKVEEDKGKNTEEGSRNSACIRLVYNQLIHNDVDEKYANQIISEIESTLTQDASVDNVLASIYQKIILKLGQLNPISLEEGKQKVIFFIGPTGVGKTTTIAKIASSISVDKKAKVALVTSDTYRIAAVEQLRTYANILGIPLKVVYTADEIEEARKEFAEYDIILVDTAGRSHKNTEQKEDIEKLINTVDKEERKIYLVLSATTNYKDLIKISEMYSGITDYNLIFTKLDETSYIGNIFNIKMFTNAPLSYVTWGQNVPDDIGRIDAQKIARQLLGGNE